METGLDQDGSQTVLGIRLQERFAGIAVALREVSPGAIPSRQDSNESSHHDSQHTGGARVKLKIRGNRAAEMYIPPWPGPSASQLSLRAAESLPYPLESASAIQAKLASRFAGRKFFYVARNGIYHLF